MKLQWRSERGQALMESAITIPILFFLLVAFLAVMVVSQVLVYLNTAVYIATTSAATAPAENGALSMQYAQETWDGTLGSPGQPVFPYLARGRLVSGSSGGGGVPCGAGGTVRGAPMTCTGTASVRLSSTPLALVTGNWNPDLSVTATVYGSPYRSR
jgi:hypothetical protein